MSGSRLTPRQRQVVELIGDGYTRAEIAYELDLSTSTVRDIISFLKAHYGCEQSELPAATGLRAA